MLTVSSSHYGSYRRRKANVCPSEAEASHQSVPPVQRSQYSPVQESSDCTYQLEEMHIERSQWVSETQFGVQEFPGIYRGMAEGWYLKDIMLPLTHVDQKRSPEIHARHFLEATRETMQYAPPLKADPWHDRDTSGQRHFRPHLCLSPTPDLCKSASISLSSLPRIKWPSLSSSASIHQSIPIPISQIFPHTAIMSRLPSRQFLNLPFHPSHLDLHLERLTSTTDSTPTSFTAQELLNYGHIRYHILVTYDSLTPESATERVLLTACQSALCQDFHDTDGRAATVSAAFQAFDQWWENILKSDYILRSSRGSISTQDGGYAAAATGNTLVRLRIFTAADGRVQTGPHDAEIQWPRHHPIRNVWPQLRVFRRDQVRVVGRRERRLGAPVVVGRGGGEWYFLQSLQQALQPDYFSNMINNYVLVLGDARFSQIVGLAESEDGPGIDGVLRQAQKGRFLDELLEKHETVPRDLRRKWKRQIEEAVRRGGDLGLRLENLMPGDVFVTEEGMDVVLYGLGTPVRSGGDGRGPIRGASPIMRYLEERM